MAIDPRECVDKIRFSMTDKTGVLRVQDFDIVDAPQCTEFAEKLKRYLTGRPVAEVDIDYIRSLTCLGDGRCVRAIVDAIAQYRDMFAETKD